MRKAPELIPLWLIAVYVLCLPVAGLGLWLVTFNRLDAKQGDAKSESSPRDGARGHHISNGWRRLVVWRATLTAASRLVVGICLILGAYHIAAYASPDAWFGLKVPRERWYILAAGVVLALLGTATADRLESRPTPTDP